MLRNSEGAKFWVIKLITYVFALGGFALEWSRMAFQNIVIGPVSTMRACPRSVRIFALIDVLEADAQIRRRHVNR